MNRIRSIVTIAKADIISTFRNFSSVFFGMLFPLIFILVFGFIGQDGANYDVAIYPDSNTDNPVIEGLQKLEFITLKESLDQDEITNDLERGDLVGAIKVTSVESNNNQNLNYDVDVDLSEVEQEESSVLRTSLENIIARMNLQLAGVEQPPLTLDFEKIAGREYKQIDFILPGQLGFSLLSSGVFGTAFLFVSLRETLVLKRFSATPIRKSSVLIGLALSKLIFALLQASVIIGVGYFGFGFTLINGFITFLSMMILSIFGLAIFLGAGLIISSIAKDQNSVAPIANLFTLPQFLLAGTFFPIEMFPEWLQPISRALPLTYLNRAMRSIAFDGAGFADIGTELLFLTIWIIVVYTVAVKVFRWTD